MLKAAKEPRETAEARFERIQKTVSNEADAERTAVRKKTARLKALRMERDAALQEAKVTEASHPSAGQDATGKRPRAGRDRRRNPRGE